MTGLHNFYVASKHALSLAQRDMAIAAFLIDHVGDTSAFPTLHDLHMGCVRRVMRECSDANPNEVLALVRTIDLPHT